MIVRDIMTTYLVTVEPDDTVSHAAHLLRQHQFHHLPVVKNVQRPRSQNTSFQSRQPERIFQGLLTTQGLDKAIALIQQETSRNPLARPWQERRVAEIMQPQEVWVTPTTSVAAAAQLLVERGMNCLPVIEAKPDGAESQAFLVGLLTRSDILLAMARALGAFEPGTQLSIKLPKGRMAPLAKALLATDELHMDVSSILASPYQQHIPRTASLRLSTINPAPLLVRLQQEGIAYTAGDSSMEGEDHG